MSEYKENINKFSQERRWRKPIKGLRVKLRNELRKLGFQGKFETDFLRRNGGTLVILTKEKVDLPIDSFMNYKLVNFYG